MFSTVIQRHPDTREIGSIWVCHSRSMCTNDSRMFTAVMQRDPYIAKTASRNWFCYHVSNCGKAKWIPKENELSTYEYKYPSGDSASLSTIDDYIAKPTPNFPFFFSFNSAPKESITCTLSQSWPSPASQISLKAAVSILYLANSLLIRTVRLSGLFFSFGLCPVVCAHSMRQEWRKVSVPSFSFPCSRWMVDYIMNWAIIWFTVWKRCNSSTSLSTLEPS